MLNKEICKACANSSGKHVRYYFDGKTHRTEQIDVPWDETDDVRWRHKEVYCRSSPKDAERTDIPIIDPTPRWCLFQLEHLMAEQKCT